MNSVDIIGNVTFLVQGYLFNNALWQFLSNIFHHMKYGNECLLYSVHASEA